MIRAAIFDTDGMVIQRDMRFSDRYAEEFGVPPGKLMFFFANEFQDCLVGKRDLKEEIMPLLADWGWKKSADELLEYWFRGESAVDNNVLSYVQQLREKGIKCYLATNSEKYRAVHLFETLELTNSFDEVFSSSSLGHKKPEQAFWGAIHEKIGTPDRNSIVAWDDDEENVRSARKFGFNAFRFVGFDDLKEQMDLCFTNM